jgi:hypothetical protein
MGIAALWLTEPMLISTSSGHGSWVGITIGAIHVADNDASVAKAGNRMVGTLIAAGFALIMLNTTAIQYTAAWLPLLSLFISACHFWRHLMDGSYFYVIQVAAFTSALLVLQPGTLTPSTAGESVETYVVNRTVMVLYGCVIYTIVQKIFLPVDSRALFESEIFKFVPLASKCFEAMQTLLPPADTPTAAPLRSASEQEPTTIANLREAMAALRTSTMSASKLYTTASHALYFGVTLPFPSRAFQGLLSEQSLSVKLLDVLCANLAHTLDYLPTESDDHARLVTKLLRNVLAPVLQQVQTCAEQQALFVDALRSGSVASAFGASLYDPLQHFCGFRQVVEELSRVYVELVEEELGRLVRQQTDLIERPLVGSLSLVLYALVSFCESMIRVGSHLEQVIGEHPVAESAAASLITRHRQEPASSELTLVVSTVA